MLFPFLPRKPHLFASESSPSSFNVPPGAGAILALVGVPAFPFLGVPGLELSRSYILDAPAPDKIADADECAHLECLRIAEVTVTHSVVMSATGSTAMATFVLDV